MDADRLTAAAFHTIKIDGVPAFAAFKKKNPNPTAPAPTEEESNIAATKMQKFVEDVWKVSPNMLFIVEATVITREELARVSALNPSDKRVSFQGCHLGAKAVLVAY